MAISANKVHVPLRAIFVNSPILCMSINTPRANIMKWGCRTVEAVVGAPGDSREERVRAAS